MIQKAIAAQFLKKILFTFRGEETEGNISVWLSVARPLLGTWHKTQACALTRNQTGNPLVLRLALNPQSHQPGQQLPNFKTTGHGFQTVVLKETQEHGYWAHNAWVHMLSLQLTVTQVLKILGEPHGSKGWVFPLGNIWVFLSSLTNTPSACYHNTSSVISQPLRTYLWHLEQWYKVQVLIFPSKEMNCSGKKENIWALSLPFSKNFIT